MKEKIFVVTEFSDGRLIGELRDDEPKYTVLCPYSNDIHGVTEPNCNCDEARQYECLMDI